MAPPQEDMQQIPQLLWYLELNDRAIPLGLVLVMRKDDIQVSASEFKPVSIAVFVSHGAKAVPMNTALEPGTLQRSDTGQPHRWEYVQT